MYISIKNDSDSYIVSRIGIIILISHLFLFTDFSYKKTL